MKVAVVIPVYNHEQRIEEVLREALKLGMPVIVVDDGSTDRTPAILKRIPDITVIRHPANLGKGAALLTGFAAAVELGCDRALTIDGDGQHRPEDAGALLQAVADGRRVIVIGRREEMTGKNVPWTSRFGRGFSNFWVWASGGPLISDSQSGFRLYPLPETLGLDVKARRYQFEVEVLVRARRQGIETIEAPIRVVYQPKGERVSHFQPWRDFCRNSSTFNRLIWERIFGDIPPMKGIGYRLLLRLARLCGSWLLVVFSRIVAAGYFLFSTKVGESRRFYGALFPERGGLYHRWCTFRQYQNFTTIHCDRFLAEQTDTTTFTSEGWEKLEAVIGKQGGILLMSHLGNWEMAAKLLSRQKDDLRLLLYMGVKEKEGVERIQKDDLRRAGVTIIGVDQEGGSPFAAVEGIRHLQSGGIVSMTGDIVWRSDQRKVRVRFLGHDAWVPESPYIFALLSGAPLFVFFAFRSGNNSYRFTLSDPIAIRPHARRDRAQAIAEAAQQYADLLEKMLRQHPFEWYHFDRFLQ